MKVTFFQPITYQSWSYSCDFSRAEHRLHAFTMSLIGHDSSWLHAVSADTEVNGQVRKWYRNAETHPRVPKKLCKHDRAGLGKSQTYGWMKPKKWKWSVKTGKTTPTGLHGFRGGGEITLQEGGPRGEGLQEFKRGTFSKSKFCSANWVMKKQFTGSRLRNRMKSEKHKLNDILK